MSRTPAWVRAAGVAIAGCWIVAGPAQATDLKSWRLLADSPAFPPTLRVPTGVYDPLRHRVLAIDGDYIDQPLVVHVFDPAPEPHWSTIAVAGPPPEQRFLASIVYDPARDRLLMLGSDHAQDVEVWALPLSGTPTWQRIVTSGIPPRGRYGHSTIYDPIHDRVILCGGADYSYPTRYQSDVWALSLSSGGWSSLAPSGAAPGGREGHGAFYDSEGRRMILFGGHIEAGARGFWNDLWELSLGDSPAWSQIVVSGQLPGARSAFGTIYDPVRRRVLIHGGLNTESTAEPDELWALSLEGPPAWEQIVTENRLRGRAYPIDIYDPVEDRLLACGGGDFPQTSELSLSTPLRWNAVLPPNPLPAPGARSRHAVVRDARRDRFIVVGGDFSTADSAMWSFDPQGANHWQAVNAPAAPYVWSDFEYSQSTVYDSLGDRIILFDGWQAWSAPAAGQRVWTPLGPPVSSQDRTVGAGAGLAVDSRRNRLLVTGGWIPYPHSGDYTVGGLWSLSLGPDPSWSFVGTLPQPVGSAGHAAFYDPVRDRLVVLGGRGRDGGRYRAHYGAVVWSTPLDSDVRWTALSSSSGASPPAPPDAHAAFDARGGRLFIAADSSIWTRGVDDTGPWTELEFSTARPRVTSDVGYDPIQDQLLALFASPLGSDDVQAWAVAVGPLAISLLEADRSPGTVELKWRSITAFGRATIVERREESSDWTDIGPIAFGPDGVATFTDHGIYPGHDYVYRVSVIDGASAWHSDPVLVADPGSLRLALRGARPNPAVGRILLAFSLPGVGPARVEIFDVSGRRRLSREVGSLGPGAHSLSLEGSASWPPGVYYAQLRREGESRTARIVVMH